MTTFTHQLNDRERVQVEITEYKGKFYLNCRIWWYSSDDEEWRPSNKGFNIPVADGKAEKFAAKFAKLVPKMLAEHDESVEDEEEEEEEKPARKPKKTTSKASAKPSKKEVPKKRTRR